MISFFIPTAGTALSGLLIMPIIGSGTIATCMIKVDTVCMAEMLPLSPSVGLCIRTMVAGRMPGLLIVRLLIDGLNETNDIGL